MSDKQNASNKDVIYIDIDDEITGIIDKVRGSHSKIVALVLPKRAASLQSIVNMKLLKRSADEAKKNLVLITSEPGLLPLAGSVGMFVAKSLQSKPEVPELPSRSPMMSDSISEDDDVIEDTGAVAASAGALGAAGAGLADKPLDKSRPVGELTGAAALDDTIELDNDSPASADGRSNGQSGADGKKDGKSKDKKLAIPNFNKFRLVLILSGVALVPLVVFGYFALAVMPKATVSIKTNSQSVTSSTVVTLKPGDATTFDADEAIIPAKNQEVQKTLNQQVDATGQRNDGEEASGDVVFSAGSCTGDVPLAVAAGTVITSNSLNFVTQEAAEFQPTISGGKCTFKSGSIEVVAQKAGASYNLDPASFAVPGRSTVTGASSTKFTGGTDDIKKIVTQGDIDNATQKISSQNGDSIKEQLKTDLVNKGYFPVPETFTSGTPQTKTSSNVGDVADTVTVTQTITYAMLGGKEADFKSIIKKDVSKKIDTKKQSILDYGLDGAVFGLQGQPDGAASLTLQTEVIAGPDLKIGDIKKQVAGKKANDAREAVKKNPGVTDVEVEYSPFWVNAIPKKESKITVTIEKPASSSDKTDASDDN